MSLGKRSLPRMAGRIAIILAVLAGASPIAASPASAALSWTVMESVAIDDICLDFDNRTWYGNPGRVSMYPCHEAFHQRMYADHSQVWTEIRTIGPPYGPANKCLDAYAMAGYPTGYRIATWDCHGGLHQQWRGISVDIARGTYVLQNRAYGLCLDMHPTSRVLGLYACHLAAHQQFWDRAYGW